MNDRKGLDSLSPPYLADYVIILSPEGKELEKLSILEALQNSSFSLLLSSLKVGEFRMQRPSTDGTPMLYGVLRRAPPARPRFGPAMRCHPCRRQNCAE